MIMTATRPNCPTANAQEGNRLDRSGEEQCVHLMILSIIQISSHTCVNGHPICAQFIERSLDGGKQGGGVEVVEENLQSDLQLIPDQGRHHDHGDHA